MIEIPNQKLREYALKIVKAVDYDLWKEVVDEGEDDIDDVVLQIEDIICDLIIDCETNI